VNWATLTPQLRHGDLVCVVHGRVAAEQAPIGIPVCPRCRQGVLVAHRDREGVLHEFAEPAPATCPVGHRLDPGRVSVGWNSCSCAAALPGPGGHRTWGCTSCAEQGETTTILWPPHPAELRADRDFS